MDPEEVRTVRYVTQDPIQNLRIRVTLTRLSALRGKPTKAETQQQESDAANTPDTSRSAGAACTHQPAASAQLPLRETKVFTWQEKVYSKAELVSAQAAIRASQQAQGSCRAASPSRRAEQLGSQLHFNTEKLLAETPEGSVLFSYVHTDEFCERAETSKAVSTSESERGNHLVQKLLHDARNRQKMLNFRCMYIMVDLGDEWAVAGSSEKVLVAVRSHPDGSFEMQPGFSTRGRGYRFEDDHGGIYEYVVDNASKTEPPALERRAAKLGAALAGCGGAALRRGGKGAGIMDLTPPPGPSPTALRLMLFGELVSGAGFQQDRLYIEWRLLFDPELWLLQSPGMSPEDQPGVIKGVTHVSRLVQYPEDLSDCSPPTWVAHWAHPLEAEWVAGAAPPSSKWPVLALQVCSYDNWDRYTCEGYGWLQLEPSPGSTTHVVQTWKPLGTRRDQQQAFFIGGSPELEDPAIVAQSRPSDANTGGYGDGYANGAAVVQSGNSTRAAASLGAGGGGNGSNGGSGGVALNKYGFKTQSSGSIKVRLHLLHQLAAADAAAAAAGEGAGGASSPCKRANSPQRRSPQRARKEVSLAVVLERARARLEDARAGGGEVAVREGVAAAAPFVRRQPEDAGVDEGGTARFSVAAGGGEPLNYHWFKDGRRLRVATADSSDLILVSITAADAGQYHCEVTNGDGSATSSKALLTVRRVSRLQRATAGYGEGGRVTREDGTESPPPPSGSISKRTTVPRTLVRGGAGGLPYNPRSGASPLRLQAAASPLRAPAASPQLFDQAGSPQLPDQSASPQMRGLSASPLRVQAASPQLREQAASTLRARALAGAAAGEGAAAMAGVVAAAAAAAGEEGVAGAGSPLQRVRAGLGGRGREAFTDVVGDGGGGAAGVGGGIPAGFVDYSGEGSRQQHGAEQQQVQQEAQQQWAGRFGEQAVSSGAQRRLFAGRDGAAPLAPPASLNPLAPLAAAGQLGGDTGEPGVSVEGASAGEQQQQQQQQREGQHQRPLAGVGRLDGSGNHQPASMGDDGVALQGVPEGGGAVLSREGSDSAAAVAVAGAGVGGGSASGSPSISRRGSGFQRRRVSEV